MSGYIPTTGEVRSDYVRDHTRNFDSYLVGRTLTKEQESIGEQFDRWLDKVQEEAWAEGFLEGVGFTGGQTVRKNPYRKNPYRKEQA